MGHKANSASAAFLSKLRRLVKETFKQRVPAKSDAVSETAKGGANAVALDEKTQSPDSVSTSSNEDTVKGSIEENHASATLPDGEALLPTISHTDAHSTKSEFSFVPETPIQTPVNESPAKLKPKIVIPRVPNTPMTPRAQPLIFEKVDSDTETDSDSDDDTPLFFSASRPNALMQRASSATNLGIQRTYLNSNTNFERKSATLKPSALKYRNVSAPNSVETELKKKISRPVSFAPSTQFHEQRYPRYRVPRQISNNIDRKPSSVALKQGCVTYKSIDRNLTPIQNVSSTLRRDHLQHTNYENLSPKVLISFSNQEVGADNSCVVETSQALRTATATSRMLRVRALECEVLKARGELQQPARAKTESVTPAVKTFIWISNDATILRKPLVDDGFTTSGTKLYHGSE
ncbi:hypothetical protein HDU81_005942 [Chytriomyces hyalinus]|nr:hypothetical protein HDU81_005942 [Chytriomyces hyalinus]